VVRNLDYNIEVAVKTVLTNHMQKYYLAKRGLHFNCWSEEPCKIRKTAWFWK